MLENEELYKKILNSKSAIENHNFFKAILREDYNNEYAKDGCNSYRALRKKIEESCDKHIPVILGTYTYSNVFDYKNDTMVPLKYSRCICCGKIMTYEISDINSINAEEYRSEYNTCYNGLEFKYMNLLNEFLELFKEFSDIDIIVKQFRNNVENNFEFNNMRKKKQITKK